MRLFLTLTSQEKIDLAKSVISPFDNFTYDGGGHFLGTFVAPVAVVAALVISAYMIVRMMRRWLR
jgi:hypothetical protein